MQMASRMATKRNERRKRGFSSSGKCRKHTLWCGKPQAQLLSRKVWCGDLKSIRVMIHATNQLVWNVNDNHGCCCLVSVNSSSNNDSDYEKSRRKKASDQTFHMIIDSIDIQTVEISHGSKSIAALSLVLLESWCFSIPIPPLPQAIAASSGPQSP